ncbi:outer membrane protein [Helicobacter acinonychis]|uniref:Outer membrane protein 21 n=2 Tax=Helicobacter acinonychis TaxID=212 RepID=Q17WD5_HELAH|nr:outer membrane protein [Helicobacter acinonychis]CAK00041.1 outer membrane protein 21 [Helicobacter acinonychis str. Sheeba]
MIKKSRTLFLSLALCASISYAEDDGGFFTVGYQLGQVMQDVQNPGGTKRDELAQALNSDVTNNINGNNTGGNVVGALSNAFSQYLYSLLGAYPKGISSNSSDVAANTLFQSAVGNGTCAAAGTTSDSYIRTQEECTAAGYYWLPSLSDKIFSTIATSFGTTATITNGTDTTFPNMQQQLAYLNAGNAFFDTVNNVLGSSSTSTTNDGYSAGAIAYLKGQQSILNGAAYSLKEDELLLEAFNSAIAANIGNKEFNSEVFTGLVQGVIDQSQKVLNQLYGNTINVANAIANGISNQDTISNLSNRVNQLPSALLNVRETLNKISTLNDQVKSMPYLPQFRAGNSRATNIMNGFYTKVGYKQFFGTRRNLGVRYYGFFSYNGASVGFQSTLNSVGIFNYGVGTDILYNIFSRSYVNRSVDMGFFGGIQLAGESINSTLKDDINVKKFGKVTSTHFQFLFDFGMRMNFGKLGEKTKRHNQHTIEFGVVVPTIYSTYYKSAGTTVKYFRPYSVYWSYGYSF